MAGSEVAPEVEGPAGDGEFAAVVKHCTRYGGKVGVKRQGTQGSASTGAHLLSESIGIGTANSEKKPSRSRVPGTSLVENQEKGSTERYGNRLTGTVSYGYGQQPYGRLIRGYLICLLAGLVARSILDGLGWFKAPSWAWFESAAYALSNGSPPEEIHPELICDGAPVMRQRRRRTSADDSGIGLHAVPVAPVLRGPATGMPSRSVGSLAAFLTAVSVDGSTGPEKAP
ncbi:hypothetical protein B0H17DRAFT_1304242 [Mycena rosella]|uniref:Uncharacterized protein n=1 Tax=Mycena rosella TaxID=1033263 RepID=A0AAD7D9K5_MYCRO|nr:hypothetical protein B0H17DRAFT_1304242 [Mycena rosella]